jgi:hypothetical protein
VCVCVCVCVCVVNSSSFMCSAGFVCAYFVFCVCILRVLCVCVCERECVISPLFCSFPVQHVFHHHFDTTQYAGSLNPVSHDYVLHPLLLLPSLTHSYNYSLSLLPSLTHSHTHTSLTHSFIHSLFDFLIILSSPC